MVAHSIRILTILLFPCILMGQSLTLSVTSPTANNSPSTFLLGSERVTITSKNFQFLSSGKTMSNFNAFSISPGYEIVSILEKTGEKGKISILSPEGYVLNSYSTVTLSDDDPSMALFSDENGEVLLRDNITNFTFYDTFGEIAISMSSSSQSRDGEAISEVAKSKNGETVVIFNPKIKRGNNVGSQAQVKMSDNTFKDIFSSTDRFLRDVTVSEDGDIVVAITAREGTEDQVIIMDKYGNRLNTITSEETLEGASISENKESITLYSTGRVMVYSLLGGNSLGATSFRSTVFLAQYFPEDDLILALTGNFVEESGVLKNVEFRAVNLQQRSITSEEFSDALGFREDVLTPKLVRVSANKYQLRGANKRVTISANF